MFLLLLSIIYLAFISLGLPDGLLGAAWPSMQQEMNVPISYAGIVSMIIALGTIISSLFSDRLTKRMGAGLVTAISVLLTASALFGFSFSHKFYMLCLWAIPYGLGAGGVDAALNNYVAIHYKSKHMSWLHAMWGIGASVGPYVMSYALTKTSLWNNGYLYIGILQIVLTIILFISLPLWKKNPSDEPKIIDNKALNLKEIMQIKGVKPVLIMFFCYCALEQTTALWASSYLLTKTSISKEFAASLPSLFFIGITSGRIISGFLTIKFSDSLMIRIGQVTIFLGIIFLLLPFGLVSSMLGLIIIGFGCAPIYPCVIHSTPELFGSDKSQAIIGVQMASAYIGTLAMPPLFGLIANHISIYLYPIYLLIILILMVVMHRLLLKRNVK